MSELTLSEAWAGWHRTIEELRAEIEATPRYRDCPEHRAQAIQSLAEGQAMAHNQIIAPMPSRPRAYHATGWNPNVLGLGQPTGDSLYGLMLLDGNRTYTVRGRLGDIAIMLMQVYDEVLGHGENTMLGNFDAVRYADADGNFEVTFSAERGNAEHWIPLAPDSERNYVLLRRFFGDWYGDMGELEVTLQGDAEPHDFADEAAVARRIEAATSYLGYMVRRYTIQLYDFYRDSAGGMNLVDYTAGETVTDIAGNPSTTYGWGVLQVPPGQAVIVEQELPDSAYWSFQIGDVWSRPLDPMHHQSDINMHRAVVDADGRVRTVTCQEDPGVPNWMDPVGRSEVVIVTRNYRELTRVDAPSVTVVPVGELRDHLPPETPTVTPEQRAADLEYRRRGLLRIYEGGPAP